MDWEKPSPAILWQAIETYLIVAYAGKGAPSAVRGRLETLRATPLETLYDAAVFERTPPEHPTRLALRLGCKFYPHMKLAIERAPDGHTSLLRADTHDRHIQVKPDSPDYAAFAQLLHNNQVLAAEIELAWEHKCLPTFKHFLREDLARRRAAESKGGGDPHTPAR